jgi:hypothetical protein
MSFQKAVSTFLELVLDFTAVHRVLYLKIECPVLLNVSTSSTYIG